MLTINESRKRLRQLVDNRVHICDEDFRWAVLSERSEAKLLKEMSEVGYQGGRTEDGQNEWWPPEKTINYENRPIKN